MINALYLRNYTKWRTSYCGGRDFVNAYLIKYSERETDADFISRKSITPCPNIIKQEVNDVITNIIKQLVYVSREGGDKIYNDAINSNIDLRYNSMTAFIANCILPELLPMSQVLVYVDMPVLTNTTRYNDSARPYVYTYYTEQIGEIEFGDNADITHLELNLEEGTEIYDLENGRVKITFDGKSAYINIPKIPAYLCDSCCSIIDDACEYQIALMNLESSDLGYCLQSNYPFLHEQYDPKAGSQFLKPTANTTGTETERTAETGAKKGRRRPHPLDPPGFIAPPTEPIKISMEKQAQLENRIKSIINGKVENIGNGQGLLYIASILQAMEIKIAEFFHYYLGKTNNTKIIYPQYFDTLTFEEKKERIDQLQKVSSSVPSKTYSKAVSKEVAKLTIGHSVAYEVMEKIESEVDAADYLTSDPEILASDVENGLVSHATASIARGYPASEVEIAKKEHAERLAEIAKSQTQGLGAGAARGVPDVGGISGKQERKAANNQDPNPTPTDPTRGKGK